MQALTDDMRAMALTGMQPRPDYGKAGRPIEILANVFPVRLKATVDVHHYDVQIRPISNRPEGEDRGPRPRGGALVAEEERRLPITVCQQVWDALPSQHPAVAPIFAVAAYDRRKSCFTPKQFPFGTGSQEFDVTLPAYTADRKPREFKVKLTHAQSIDTSCLATWGSKQPGATDLADRVALCLMALDVLFRHDQFRQPHVVTAGRGSKFFSGAEGISIGQGAEVLSGFFQSIRPSVNGLIVNLDTAYSPYLSAGNLVKVAFEIVGRTGGGGGFGGGRGGGPRGRGGPPRGGRGGFGGGAPSGPPSSQRFSEAELRQLKTKLRGAKIRVVHRASTQEFAIQSFGKPPREQMFSKGAKTSKPSVTDVAAAAAAGQPTPAGQSEGGEMQSVADYFQQTYNFRLQYPDLQVVQLKGGVFIPMEAVELLPGTGIPPTRLSSDQAAAMIKVAAKRPIERRQLIEQQRQKVNYQSNQRIQAWGVDTSPQMAGLTGRVLPPPRIQYHPQGKIKEVRANAGAWNLVDTRFIQPGRPLETWGAVVIGSQNDLPIEQFRSFITMLVKQCQARGITVNNPTPILQYGNPADRVQAVKNLARDVVMNNPRNPNKLPPQLLIFILRDPKLYDDVKRCATIDLPVPVVSQALLLKNVKKDRGLDQYCGNVAMKINVKLSGSNWALSPQDLPGIDPKTMFLGADVTHPPPGRAGEASTSIAALVGTTSAAQGSVTAQVRQQEGRVEIIQDLQSMAVALIRGWLAKNGNQRPEKIIFFRDGVSEGQYSTVVDHEIRAVKAACREIDPRYAPKLTYIVCAKRHHVRFFAKKEQDTDRSGNLPAGTVVDTGVTHPYLFDFYLQSQAGLVGTACPAHYIALLDENGFNSDSMQKLVNSMCFSFARATRSVSLIPVAYYADIVCTKCRSLVYMDDDTSSQVSGASTFDPLYLQKKLERTSGQHSLSGMWFI